MRAIKELGRDFGFAVAATTLFALPACAQDAPANQVQPTPIASISTTAPRCVDVEGFAVPSCATAGYETPMTLAEIAADKAFYSDRVIIHFNRDIVDADLLANVLTRRGTPTIAIPGGPECGIRLIVDGHTNENMCFTQSNMNRGEVGGLAERGFKAIQKRKMATRQTTSLDTAALNR